jgi:hypothetical protein
MNRIQGICIKQYKDEDDLRDYEEGNMEYEDIRIYKVGDEGEIVSPGYSDEYWRAK